MVPTAAAPPAAALPAAQERSAAAKSDEELYELVYDDLPAKPTTPKTAPTTPGMPVGRTMGSTAAPHGLPVGKPLGTNSVPQNLPAGKPLPANPTTQGLPAGKPVQPTIRRHRVCQLESLWRPNRRVCRPKPVQPTKASAPAAATPATTKMRLPRTAPKRRNPATNTATPTAPSKPAARAAQPAQRPAAKTPLIEVLPDDDLPDGIGDALDSLALSAEPADIGRRCPGCLSRLPANSNICPSCGRDATEPEPVAQELPVELVEKHTLKSKPSGNRVTASIRLGLKAVCAAQFLILLAVILQLIATLADEPLNFDAPSPLAWATIACAGLGFVCSCASSVLCLIVPQRSGARGMIYLKNVCDAGTIGLLVAFVQEQLPPNAGWLIAALAISSVVPFILFMRKLAIYAGSDNLAQSVLKLLWKTVGFIAIVAFGSLFSAMIGSETFMLARVVGVVGWMYVLFNFTLVAQQLGHALRVAEAAVPAESTGNATGAPAVSA